MSGARGEYSERQAAANAERRPDDRIGEGDDGGVEHRLGKVDRNRGSIRRPNELRQLAKPAAVDKSTIADAEFANCPDQHSDDGRDRENLGQDS